MFREARNRYNSTFYGYSNGDVLYDSGLIQTLNACERTLARLKQILIVGQRHNFNPGGRELYRPGDVRRVALGEGQLFRTDAEDYFILGGWGLPLGSGPGGGGWPPRV